MKPEEAIEKLLAECNEFIEDNPIEYGLELPVRDVKIIADALEKQVPKKPVDIYNRVPFIEIYCPDCERNLTDEYGNRYEYCPDCGTPIDWSDE